MGLHSMLILGSYEAKVEHIDNKLIYNRKLLLFSGSFAAETMTALLIL